MRSENPNQENSEAQTGNRPANQHSDQPNPEVPPMSGPAETNPPQPPDRREVSSKTHRDWHDHTTLWVQIVGVIFLIAYTTFAALMWCEMRKSTRAAIAAVATAKQSLTDANKNFAQDQRPYIWKIASHPHPIVINQNIAVDIYFANYGKTPAINVKTFAGVFYGKNAMKQADSWFSGLDNRPPKIGSMTIVPPGIPPDPQRIGVLFTTATSDKIPTQDEINHITTIDGSLIWVSRTEYFDTGGSPYRSDICEFRLATGVMANCLIHNEIK